MNPYYEICRHRIEPDVEHIKVIHVPALIDLMKTTVETDARLKDEIVIVARRELEPWGMSFKFHKHGDVLNVIWGFDSEFEEGNSVLGLLSFTIRIHPDDYAKMDFPEGQTMVFGTR